MSTTPSATSTTATTYRTATGPSTKASGSVANNAAATSTESASGVRRHDIIYTVATMRSGGFRSFGPAQTTSSAGHPLQVNSSGDGVNSPASMRRIAADSSASRPASSRRSKVVAT